MTEITYLSRIVMPYESVLQKGLRSSYDWHRWIWKSFPNDPDRKRDFLFRVDVQERQVRILLLSEDVPAAIESWAWESKRVSDEFLNQSAYRFQVRVNPTFRRASDHKRIALYKESDIREWLKRKMSAIGAELVSAEVDQPRDELFVKDGKRGKHVSVDVRGVISVKNLDLFCQGFLNGIGSAKGFGYGLLMLQPIQL